jgi:hypothetical protein
MPIRFFKPIKLGSGLKLNISKSGLGLSQRMGPLTIGTRRTTLDLPGTGASIYKTNSTGGKSAPAGAWAALIGGFVVIMCCLCFGFSMLLGSTGDKSSTGTPTPPSARNIPIIASTAAGAINPTNSVIPENTTGPVTSVTPMPPPTYQYRPSWTPEIVTETQPVVLPTLAPPSRHPAGTSGLCKDGTYTYAAHKQGACSHHGGVASWWGP